MYSLKPFPRLLYRPPLRIRIRRWHMVGLVQTQCPWYNVRRRNYVFFFISLSLSLSFFSRRKIRHETTGCFEILEAARFTIESSRVIPRPSVTDHTSSLSRRSVTSRKDEISFHETSERNTRRLSLRGDTLPHFPSYIHRVVSLYSELDEMYRCKLVIFRSSVAIFTKIHKTEQLNILSILRVSFLLLFLSLVLISLFSYTLL